MTRRGGIPTYKVLERSSNRMLVVKVIKKSEKVELFQSIMEPLQKCISRYLVWYSTCAEKERQYEVLNRVLCNGIDSKRVLRYGISEGIHVHEKWNERDRTV